MRLFSIGCSSEALKGIFSLNKQHLKVSAFSPTRHEVYWKSAVHELGWEEQGRLSCPSSRSAFPLQNKCGIKGALSVLGLFETKMDFKVTPTVFAFAWAFMRGGRPRGRDLHLLCWLSILLPIAVRQSVLLLNQ